MNPFLEPYRVLGRVINDGAHLKIALSELGAGPHGRTVKISYGVFENYAYLGLCVDSVAERPPKPAVRLIMQISFYARLFLDMPPAVCVNEAVSLAKIVGKGGAAGFLKAALRAFDESRVRVPEGLDGLVVKSNFPRFAAEELVARYGARASEIMLARSAGVCVRFVRGEERYRALPQMQTPFAHAAIFPNFTRDEGYERGDYTFQSVGSIAICSVVDTCARLLDACAAPGGKSVLLAERCGEVTACDVHPHRVALIESYARRMHAENVRAICRDSTVFCAAWEGAFDGVLVDAPCSGLGTVSENPDLPLRKNEGGMSEIMALQARILDACARYVKAGGCLYYSTCSVLDGENDGAVGAFLERHGEFAVEGADCPLPHEKTAYGLQFLPDTAFGAGFYVAKLRRRP